MNKNRIFLFSRLVLLSGNLTYVKQTELRQNYFSPPEELLPLSVEFHLILERSSLLFQDFTFSIHIQKLNNIWFHRSWMR